jgi:hypothetical protein
LFSKTENVHRKNKLRNNLRENFGDLYLLAQLRNPCSFHDVDSTGTDVSVHTFRAHEEVEV